jgi:starch synthase
VREGQPRGVQGMARQLETREIELRQAPVGGPPERTLVGPIKLVADDARSESGKVKADLVLPARLEPADHARVDLACWARSHFPDVDDGGRVRPRWSSAHSHFDPRRTLAIELDATLVSKVSCAVAGIGDAPSECNVGLFHILALLEELLESSVAGASLGDQDYPARLPVEPVPERHERAIGAGRLKHLDERILVVAGRRMDGQHCGLVDGEHMLVLEENWNVYGGLRVVPRGAPEQNALLGLHPVVGLEPAASGVVCAGAHDGLRPGPARAVKLAVHEHVQPLPRVFGGHTKHGNDRAFGHSRRADELDFRCSKARHESAHLEHLRAVSHARFAQSRRGPTAPVPPCYDAAPMDITFVTTELAPFVKVGGLADVSAALPKALRGLGHAVTVVVPRFPAFEAQGLLLARRLTPLRFSLGERAFEVTLLDGRLASQVDLVVVDSPHLFDREGVYGERGEDYPDNALRFAVLSRAAAELVRQRAAAGRPVDVVHCNDWPTALVPTYLRELAREIPALAATHTVLTIHNVAHQGVFPKGQLETIGLGWDAFRVEGIEFYGGINFLKQGIVDADVITTVSPSYAREIQTAEHGARLDGVLRKRSEALVGIVNGVDYAVWNPATDPALAARYDAEDFRNKARCKGALQSELGLPIDVQAPIVAFVGRLAQQKGADVVASVLPKILRATGAQVVIAGDGDAAVARSLADAAAKSAGRAVFAQAASEPLAHRIFAGADVLLVPSRYEPCGLVQMYAHRYGAIPVARATGGLADTIVDCDAKLETGTGFLYDDPEAAGLLGATERALAAMALPRWPALVRRAMRLDRGWEGPARRYEQAYAAAGAR